MVHGVMCAVVTPFKDGRIAEQCLRRHLDMLLSCGIHGLIVAGSSGEGHLLTREERQRLLAVTLQHVAGRAPVLLGASLPSTDDTLGLCRYAAGAGAAGVLLTPPYYYRPTFDELCASLAAACEPGLPAMLYNTPDATGTDVTPEMIARLVRTVPLAAVKESSGKLERIAEIRRLAPALDVYVGTDSIALPGLAGGAVGWVTGAANIIPRESVELYNASRGDAGAAARLFGRLAPLCVYIEESGRYVPCLKAALEMRGAGVGDPRPPLARLEPAAAAILSRHLTLATSGALQPIVA